MDNGESVGKPTEENSAYEKFRSSRRMFCVKGNKVHIAPSGVALSHLEWFRHEGWLDGGESEEEKFFRHVVKGYYVSEDNAIYCFKEIDFIVDAEIMDDHEATQLTDVEIK